MSPAPRNNQNARRDVTADANLNIRVYAAELSRWRAYSKRAGMTLSAWVRRACNGESGGAIVRRKGVQDVEARTLARGKRGEK